MRIFLIHCKSRKDWDAICGRVPVTLDDYYRISDIMIDHKLFKLLEIFSEKNSHLLEQTIEECKDLAGLELIPEELLDKIRKKLD